MLNMINISIFISFGIRIYLFKDQLIKQTNQMKTRIDFTLLFLLFKFYVISHKC